MKNKTSIGNKAESAAAEYLKKQKFSIIDRNWRTRFCEIDIVAKRKKIIHFIEVKYRYDNKHGRGIDYVTQQKLNQMIYAASQWVTYNNYQGDYCLSVIAVSGSDFEVNDFIEDIT